MDQHLIHANFMSNNEINPRGGETSKWIDQFIVHRENSVSLNFEKSPQNFLEHTFKMRGCECTNDAQSPFMCTLDMPNNNTFNYQMDLNDYDDDTNDVIPFQEPSDPHTSEEPSLPEQPDLLNCVLKRHEEMKMDF